MAEILTISNPGFCPKFIPLEENHLNCHSRKLNHINSFGVLYSAVRISYILLCGHGSKALDGRFILAASRYPDSCTEPGQSVISDKMACDMRVQTTSHGVLFYQGNLQRTNRFGY